MVSQEDAQSNPESQRAARKEPQKFPFQCGLSSQVPGSIASGYPGVYYPRGLLVMARSP